MTKPARLYAQLQANSSRIVSFRDFEALLAAAGFTHERTTGSHRHYVHPSVRAIFTVSPNGKDPNGYQVRRFLAIMRDHKLSIAE